MAIFGIIAVGAAAGDPHRGDRPVGRLRARPGRRDRGRAAGARARRSRSRSWPGSRVGAACAGVVNGVLVAVVKLPPFIATLGMLGIARGVVLVLTDARDRAAAAVGVRRDRQRRPSSGCRTCCGCSLVVALTVAFVLRRTVFGRYIYAVGSNPESARLAGVPVKRVLISVYAISGLLAAVGGVLLTSRLNAGVPTAGTGYELNAIAACVIGGASACSAPRAARSGAAGRRADRGARSTTAATCSAINPFYLQIIIGALILAAVAFDQLQGKRHAGGRLERDPRARPRHDRGQGGAVLARRRAGGRGHRAATAPTTAPGGRVEQDPGDWWRGDRRRHPRAARALRRRGRRRSRA